MNHEQILKRAGTCQTDHSDGNGASDLAGLALLPPLSSLGVTVELLGDVLAVGDVKLILQ